MLTKCQFGHCKTLRWFVRACHLVRRETPNCLASTFSNILRSPRLFKRKKPPGLVELQKSLALGEGLFPTDLNGSTLLIVQFHSVIITNATMRARGGPLTAFPRSTHFQRASVLFQLIVICRHFASRQRSSLTSNYYAMVLVPNKNCPPTLLICCGTVVEWSGFVDNFSMG